MPTISPITSDTNLDGLDDFYQGRDGPSFRFLQTLLKQPSTRAWELQTFTSQGPANSKPAKSPLAVIWYCVAVDEADLVDLRVAEATRRQGLGQRLLKHSLGELAKAGVTRCHLEVRRSNSPALALYEHIGFAITGERPNYYPVQGGFEDAILMTLDMGPDMAPE